MMQLLHEVLTPAWSKACCEAGVRGRLPFLESSLFGEATLLQRRLCRSLGNHDQDIAYFRPVCVTPWPRAANTLRGTVLWAKSLY